jgi:hypothetical protein
VTSAPQPRVELRPDWYQVVYNLAAQHAHRAVKRAPKPPFLKRFLDAFDGDDEDAARKGASERDVQDAIRYAKLVLGAALATTMELRKESRSKSKSSNDDDPRNGNERDKQPDPSADLLQFLERTVAPTTAILLAGLFTRPGLGDPKIRVDLPPDGHPDTSSWLRLGEQLQTMLSSLGAQDADLVTPLLQYAAAAPERNYRVDYNLACFIAGRLTKDPDLDTNLVTRALKHLQQALDGAQAVERLALADWAAKDPSLRPLQAADGERWNRLIAQYQLPLADRIGE